MITITNYPKNQKLAELVREMNIYCKGTKGYYDHLITFKRPTENKGYFDLLKTAIQLGTFTWDQVLLCCDNCVNIVAAYTLSIKSACNTIRYEYINNHTPLSFRWLNSITHTSFRKYSYSFGSFYRSFFNRHGIFEKAGKRGQYRVSQLGIELFKALNTQLLINKKML